MAKIRCDRGHFYNPEKHVMCPYCGVDIDLPVPASTPPGPGTRRPVEAFRPGGAKRSSAEDTQETRIFEGSEAPATQRVHEHVSGGIDPVCGWLICIEGPQKGQSFSILSEKNYLGRSDTMDIVLEDEYVSNENHASIMYIPEKNVFRVAAGQSRSLVWLDDDTVDTSEEIHAGQVIRVGKSRLMFVPFCGVYYNWFCNNDKR